MKKTIKYEFDAGPSGDSCDKCRMRNNCPYPAEIDGDDRKTWLNGFRSDQCKNND